LLIQNMLHYNYSIIIRIIKSNQPAKINNIQVDAFMY
jgi:hypothetical protein